MMMKTLMSTSQAQNPIKKMRKTTRPQLHHLPRPFNPNAQVPNLLARNPSCPNSTLQLPHRLPLRRGTLRLKLHLRLARSVKRLTKVIEPRTFKRRIKIDIPGCKTSVIKKEIDQVTKIMTQEPFTFPQVHGKHLLRLKSNTGSQFALCETN